MARNLPSQQFEPHESKENETHLLVVITEKIFSARVRSLLTHMRREKLSFLDLP